MENKGQRTPTNATVRLIDNRLYHYEEIKKAVHDIRLDDGSSKTEIPRHAYVSDPTANTAIKKISEIKYVVLDDGTVVTYPQRWIKVITALYGSMEDRERQALEMRYNDGQKYSYITHNLNISTNMLYCIINDARNFMISGACQYGMIRVIA